MGGVNACLYGGCCQTVFHQLAQRYGLVRKPTSRGTPVSERNRPAEEGLKTATIGSTRVTPPHLGAAYDSSFTNVT